MKLFGLKKPQDASAGTSRSIRKPSSAAAEKNAPRESPTTLGVPGLLAIWGMAGVAMALGMVQVKVQFDARDYEIETRRIQQLTTLRRDDVKRMEARLGSLKRDENLRSAALGPLGMVEPSPELVRSLDVDPVRESVYRDATRRAIENLQSKRQAYAAGNTIEKEDP